MKKTHDYDNTFQMLKTRHKRFMIAIINDCFGKNYQKALTDLAYFRDMMIELHQHKELTEDKILDLNDCIKVIVSHITDGNSIEEEVPVLWAVNQ